MKRFYSVLFIGAALLSGNVYGMEREVNIRDYADVMDHLTTTANFRADDEFEDLAITALPGIEDFVIANNKQDERQYAQLCASYLNKVFSLRECDVQQVEIKFMERFFDESPLALFYLQHKREVIGQLNLDKLALVMQNVTDKKSRNMDTLMVWLSIFDETGHQYEQMLVDTLGAEINARGLTSTMRPWERTILQKGGHLQGLGKEYIDALRHKEQIEINQRQQLRMNAEKRKDQIAGHIFNALKAKNDKQLDDLINDELIGGDAPLGDYCDYINEQIQARLQNPKVKDREELLNRWNAKFATLPAQINPELLLIIDDNQQPQKSTVEELINRVNATINIVPVTQEPLVDIEIPQQPVIDQPQQPDFAKALTGRPDNPGDKPTKGVAALLASIGAPKLAIAAVVVGVCYWGYTKYKARKAAQSDFAKASTDKESASVKTTADKENNDQAVRTTQNVQKKKESVRSKQRVR